MVVWGFGGQTLLLSGFMAVYANTCLTILGLDQTKAGSHKVFMVVGVTAFAGITMPGASFWLDTSSTRWSEARMAPGIPEMLAEMARG